MEPKIIFEDKFLLVIDKPAGWVVNEAETTGKNPVIQTWLKKLFDYEIVGEKEFRSGIVHRLDKETSGVLIVTKTKGAFRHLQAQFKSREVQKIYVALVHGEVVPKEGEINAPLGRLPWNRKRFGILPGGRKAVTQYRVISNLKFPNSNEKYSLLELYPKTGRTHQIRVHLKYLGHPVVSDEFYAGRKTARADRKWCPRLFLHASEITFSHPESINKVHFKSNLPQELETALSSLEKAS